MHIRPKNVFKAICYGHGCSIESATRPGSRASLVDISATSARLMLLTDADSGGQALLRRGDDVALHPHFLESTGFETIRTRVIHVNGKDVTLRFESPLPFPSSRLAALTRR